MFQAKWTFCVAKLQIPFLTWQVLPSACSIFAVYLLLLKLYLQKKEKLKKVWNNKFLHRISRWREMTRWNRNEPKVSLLFRNWTWSSECRCFLLEILLQVRFRRKRNVLHWKYIFLRSTRHSCISETIVDNPLSFYYY